MSRIKDYLMTVSDDAYDALKSEAPEGLVHFHFGDDPQGFLYEDIAEGFEETHGLLISIYEDIPHTIGERNFAPKLLAVIRKIESLNPGLETYEPVLNTENFAH